MDITFISSITPDDEVRVASAFLDLVGAVLDSLPLAYTVRIQTADGTTLERTHPTMRLNSPLRPTPPAP